MAQTPPPTFEDSEIVKGDGSFVPTITPGYKFDPTIPASFSVPNGATIPNYTEGYGDAAQATGFNPNKPAGSKGGGLPLGKLIKPGLAAAGAASALAGSGGGGDDKYGLNAASAGLAAHSKSLETRGAGYDNQSESALAPILAYYKRLLGDDPGGVMDATRQERGQVISQYDTARRAAANFGPRGGGATGAMADSRFAEGEALAGVTANARQQGLQGASAVGLGVAGLGLNADQIASMDLNGVINAALAREGIDTNRRGQNMEALGGLGEGVGSILATYFGGK